MITRFNFSMFPNTRKHTWLSFFSEIKIAAVRRQQQHVGRHSTQDDYKIISKHHSYAYDKYSSYLSTLSLSFSILTSFLANILSLSFSSILMLSNNIHPIRSMQSPYYTPSNFVVMMLLLF